MSDAFAPLSPVPFRRPENWMLDRLPPWMLSDDVFRGFASAFQELATSWLEHADQLADVFDPDLAPPPMVQQLARWIGVDGVDPSAPIGHQRRLVREVGALCRRQGTPVRLVEVLRLATGGSVAVHDPGGVVAAGEAPPSPGVLRIELGSLGHLDVAAVAALVRREVPAWTMFELVLEGVPAWPLPARSEAEAGEAEAGRLSCPECGEPCAPSAGDLAADGFCPVCDCPLFWVLPALPAIPPVVRPSRPGDIPEGPAPVGAAVPVGERSVDCPQCRMTADVPLEIRHAGWFCPGCDFPLFWAPGPAHP